MTSLGSRSVLRGTPLVATIMMEPTTISEDLLVALTDMEAITMVIHRIRSTRPNGGNREASYQRAT
jgi:hypothetical protein